MERVTAQDLIRWSAALAGVARTGLGFTDSLYERERFEEILHIAGDIRARADHELDPHHRVSEWMRMVGQGSSGYVTPKVAVGAVVGNDAGELLLIQRSDNGVWLYPTGWADIGYSPAEVAVMPSMSIVFSSRSRSSAPQVKAPCAPPPCRARLTTFRAALTTRSIRHRPTAWCR